MVKLVIVESAGKIKKINEYLGKNYIVKASFGHCMDLDPNQLSIDVENKYKPTYIISKGKQQTVNELQNTMKECDQVILATDNDREGEAIAWSLSVLLGLKNPHRIVFTEITKNAINEAISTPKLINMDMVHAQQTRRLLDRLVGYKISPLLKNNLNDPEAKSAGRVQSVVVKIINDKENEINNSISNPYYKTKCELELKGTNINTILIKNNNIYIFKEKDDIYTFLKLFNKNSIFKVISVDNKESIRKPSPPFITSTLQQDASTKLRFNCKKTMDIAQKLYEAGLITYMRTDSPNLSQDAINSCAKYICDTYGEQYSNPKKYKSNNDCAQEAHEAIRPTNIENINIDKDVDQNKLYDLIWKRTIASQMSPAKINIQSIFIDTLNEDKSILNKCIWLTTYESIIFDGYLIVYDNMKNDDTEDKQIGQIEIKINDILNLIKIKTSQEYEKLPLRYNEANLVKYLEKNNIGRPSTYASIIDKIIDRKYVEIKNIDGIKKETINIELNNKYKIKENIKDIIIGKEQKKIIPTSLGIKITEFLETNFTDIMQIDFTSEFETFLDQIAQHKAKWYNILDIFYKKIIPMIDKLNVVKMKNTDNILGLDSNNNQIFIGSGKYGPYIKYNYLGKMKYISIENTDINIDDALKLISYPKKIGQYNKKNIELNNGKYGLYIKYDGINYSINNNIDIDIDKAIEIIKSKNNNTKTFNYKNKIYNIKNGEYGPYIQIIKNDKRENISIPKNYNYETITIEQILEIIKNKINIKK